MKSIQPILNKFTSIFDLVNEFKGVKLYISVVNISCFKRNLSIVYLVKQVGNKVYNAIFY